MECARHFYFAVCTLTTSNVADPRLVLTSEPIRVFTALYVLIGIGILVETARRIGIWYVKTRSDHGLVAMRTKHQHSDMHDPRSPPPTSSTSGS